ncbi:MAG: hypothetical protein ACKO0Z_02220 [Betaproteobacteria bacterium]
MSDKVIEFPSRSKTLPNGAESTTQVTQDYTIADMLECLEAMQVMINESYAMGARPVSIAITVTQRDSQNNLESYSAYCANEKCSVLGSLVALQHRILTEEDMP